MSLRERLESRLSMRREEDRAAEEARMRRASRGSLENASAERSRPRVKEDDSSLTSSASRFAGKTRVEELASLRVPARRLPETDRTTRVPTVSEERLDRRPKHPVAESGSRKSPQQDPRRGRLDIAANTTAPRPGRWDDFNQKRAKAGKALGRDAEASQPIKQKRVTTREAEVRSSESTNARQAKSAHEGAVTGRRSAEGGREDAVRRDAAERARSERVESPVIRTVVPAVRAAEWRSQTASGRTSERKVQEVSAAATTNRKDRAESIPRREERSSLDGQDGKPSAKRESQNRPKEAEDRPSATMRPQGETPARRARRLIPKAVPETRPAKASQVPQFRRTTAWSNVRSALADAATGTSITPDPNFDPTFTSIATPVGIYPPPTVPLPALTTQDAYVLTPDSVAVGLHGVNVIGFDALQSTSDARSALGLDDVSLAVLRQLWHFNVVRLPFQAQTILGGTSALSADDFLNILTEIVSALGQSGLYVLLALEIAPGLPAQSPDATTVQALQTLAGLYPSNTAVLYEISATTEPLTSAWIESATSLIATIRSQSPAALIFVNSGNGGFDLMLLPLLSANGEAMFGVAYTINLGGGLPTPDVNLLASLAGRCPVCATQWTQDEGPISAYVADMLGRNGIHWIASGWNADPLLANDVVDHDYSATSWGSLAIRAALYPVRPFLLPFGRTIASEPRLAVG